MNLFSRPKYESEFTLFLRELKQRDPAVQERQRAGRALLWDKAPVNPEESQRNAASTVKRHAYTYE